MSTLNTPRLTGNYTVDLSISVLNPEFGFEAYFVSGTNTGYYFYGQSGYCFDKSGNFFGGYSSGSPINLKINVFENRLSYSHDDFLCHNNISVSGPVTGIYYGAQTNIYGNIKF